MPAHLTAYGQAQVERSRSLIQDSRARIAEARQVLQDARQALARQCYVRIQCAWCGQTMRFARGTVATRGQTSHSICYACFSPIFAELRPEDPAAPLVDEYVTLYLHWSGA